METFQIIVWVIFGVGFLIFLALALYFNAFHNPEKEKEETPLGCFGKLLVCVLIILACLFIISMCTSGLNNAPWEPRHTYIQKPMQKNVNNIIFTTLS